MREIIVKNAQAFWAVGKIIKKVLQFLNFCIIIQNVNPAFGTTQRWESTEKKLYIL